MRKQRTAFTLIELVSSMAVMGVLMTGIGAAMVLAARAVPDRKSELGAVLEAERVAALMSEELMLATTVPTRLGNEITFTVPDRNGDNNPETIRYRWSATAGAPLQREYNGASSSNVTPAVYEFGIQYTTRMLSSKNCVTSVRLKLRTCTDSATRVETAVTLLNAPEAAGGDLEVN